MLIDAKVAFGSLRENVFEDDNLSAVPLAPTVNIACPYAIYGVVVSVFTTLHTEPETLALFTCNVKVVLAVELAGKYT
ncbi:hypothetical protein [[Clostridium] dakarense]|uniref:hypothetical protein n=1 Tax=Faecalimicrobium dakarense TaxID=1301100 RepID=UPI001FA7796F|nr:hypothetical protein [[Clostridium] dakarense]